MTWYLLFFAALLALRGRKIREKKTLAVYAGVGLLGILLLIVFFYANPPHLAELILGYQNTM